MSKLKIDEKHIKELVNSVKDLMEHLNQELKFISDKNKDVFTRYMAYSHMNNLIQVTSATTSIFRDSFKMGFDLKNEVFHTKDFKRLGWQDGDAKENPFFEQEEEDNEEQECEGIAIKVSDLPEEVKEMLAPVLMKVMKERKKECH